MTAYPANSSPYVNDYDYVREAFHTLAKGAPEVAKALVDVAVNGKSEIAKVTAGVAVFDRIGLPAKVDIGLTATHLVGVVDTPGTQTVDTVRARLAQLRAQQLAAQQPQQSELGAPEGDANSTEDGGVVLHFPRPHVIEGDIDED